MSYKISDRVRVIQSFGGENIKEGDEGVIVNLISAHFYRIKLDSGISVNLSARQFEKVEQGTFDKLNDIKARRDVLNLGNHPDIKVKYPKDGKFYVLAYDHTRDPKLLIVTSDPNNSIGMPFHKLIGKKYLLFNGDREHYYMLYEILDETPLKLKRVASGSLAKDFDVTYNY